MTKNTNKHKKPRIEEFKFDKKLSGLNEYRAYFYDKNDKKYFVLIRHDPKTGKASLYFQGEHGSRSDIPLPESHDIKDVKKSIIKTATELAETDDPDLLRELSDENREQDIRLLENKLAEFERRRVSPDFGYPEHSYDLETLEELKAGRSFYDIRKYTQGY